MSATTTDTNADADAGDVHDHRFQVLHSPQNITRSIFRQYAFTAPWIILSVLVDGVVSALLYDIHLENVSSLIAINTTYAALAMLLYMAYMHYIARAFPVLSRDSVWSVLGSSLGYQLVHVATVSFVNAFADIFSIRPYGEGLAAQLQTVVIVVHVGAVAMVPYVVALLCFCPLQHAELQWREIALPIQATISPIAITCAICREDIVISSNSVTADASAKPNEETTVVDGVIPNSHASDDYSSGNLRGCGHAFHRHCLMQWLVIRSNCPTCRAPVVYESAV